MLLLQSLKRHDLLENVSLCLPTFHSYGHKVSCQVCVECRSESNKYLISYVCIMLSVRFFMVLEGVKALVSVTVRQWNGYGRICAVSIG